MCGVAGVVDLRGRPPLVRTLQRALGAIAHRGPDGEGLLIHGEELSTSGDATPWPTAPGAAAGPSIALGHRRLAVTDVPRGGQPMTRDGRFWISFNGAVYNAPELREELRARGERFTTTTDTEVVLAAWIRYGEAALERFNGMWAFAVWDARERELVCVRDRFGVKPLVWMQDDDLVAFASEPKALRAFRPLRPDPRAVQRFLHYGAVSGDGPETPFDGVHSLPHGALLRVSARRVAVERWFAPRVAPAPSTFQVAFERLRELLDSSVRLRLRADVPVGACLSGGVDSSAIVALAARAPGFSGRVVASEHPSRPDIDERAWVVAAAGAAGVQVSFVHADEEAFGRELDAHVQQKDDFFSQSGDWVQRRVFARARALGLPVMLSGQGADELFAGYEPWPIWLAELRDRGSRGRAVLEAFLSTRRRASLPVAVRSAVAETLRAAGVLDSRPSPPPPLVPWLGPRALERGVERVQLDDERSIAPYLARKFDVDHLPVLLRSEDRNAMAFGVECRLPFLDHRLVAFARGLPPEFSLRRGWTKAVLRAALRGVVPDAVLDRPIKLGFPGPIEDGARTNVVAILRAWEVLRRDEWVRGDFPVDPTSFGGRRLGFRVRVAEAFLRVCVGGQRGEQPTGTHAENDGPDSSASSSR